MDGFIVQLLNGLDKGAAYALIALGLTLIFGTLGVVNFAHGALFMIGAFCAVTLNAVLRLSYQTVDPTQLDFLGNPMQVSSTYLADLVGPDWSAWIIDWSVPLSVLAAVPLMVLIGFAMERGLMKHFYKRPHADQILVTFGLAIVLQEIIKAFFGANPIQTPAPDVFRGSFDFGAMIGFPANRIVYPDWRMVYFLFSAAVLAAGVRLPAIYHLRHGGPGGNGRPRDSGPARHRYRPPFYADVRSGRGRGGCGRGDVRPYQRA
jgi:branched-subunit amino acid ABC-type transport system permease component